MSRLVASLDRILYPRSGDHWDADLFHDYVSSRARSSHQVLDLGAGPGRASQTNLRGRVANVCGIDLDARVLHNSYLDEAKRADAADIPYSDSSFDLVLADNVLEHLSDPESVFAEVARVLRPGGAFMIKTPNRWHYATLIARLTPHGLHERFNEFRGRPPGHTFLTHYAANTETRIRRLATLAGLRTTDLRYLEGRPEYLRFNPATYLLGYVYERIVNRTERLRALRIVLMGTLEKPPPP